MTQKKKDKRPSGIPVKHPENTPKGRIAGLEKELDVTMGLLAETQRAHSITLNNLTVTKQHLDNARKDAAESRTFAEEHHAAMILLDALEAAPREGYTFLNGARYPLTLRQRLVIALNPRR